MSKKLIITEKPSVAADLARALGGFVRHEDYFESDDYVLSSAIGHLLELACPEEYEVKRGKWSFAHLPVIPPHFTLQPIAKTESRLKLLVRLIKRKDVVSLVNACDAGREGELIFNYITQHAANGKPVERLWLQSMTPQAIKEGFMRLRKGAEMRGLGDAAVCRSESDWLVGINGTRAMTAFNSKTGGFHLTTVGRVQTPSLALIVEREDRIRKFKPRPYWELEGVFVCSAGEYRGKWFDEKFKGKDEDEHARADRLWDEAKGILLQQKCAGKMGDVSEESKASTQLSPLLFDLTSLQREANGRYGFSAKVTLGLAQALYEKHKVLTYPRTDSRALPEDYLSTVSSTLSMLTGEGVGKGHDEAMLARYAPFAKKILESHWVIPNKRIFNNAKISDHFAIIPTLQAPKHLSEPESKLYDMVVKRFLAVFYPAAEFLITTRISRVQSEPFKTEGRVLVNPGWLVVYGRDAHSDGEGNLVAVAPEEQVRAEEMVLSAHQTKPPARYSEASLLTAMESAGKAMDDEELRAAMAGRGLGTPATRAQIIENLLSEQYLIREGRELQPTAKAFSLMTLLNGLGIRELTAPELTGEWEWKLARMERGEMSRREFMKEIATMTQHIVDRAKSYDSDSIPGDFGELSTPCPKCGGLIKETYKKFQCQTCDFALWKIVAGRQFEATEIEDLLTKRKVGPLSGFRNKMGRPFNAIVQLNAENAPEFDFGQGTASDEGSVETVDFSDSESLGACPKCAARVFAHGMAYVCEKSVGPAKSCDFRSGTIILQQPVEPEQMRKLLDTGRTDLLRDFISARTRRKFSAYLVRGADGKVGFEFEKRATKVAAKTTKGTPALTSSTVPPNASAAPAQRRKTTGQAT
ncbi:DNA topoisomerase III [Candidatus Accumulibacter vicinus]|uniref:DNA topoisomerase n=1 Tax=Candidatus Accumulibacter vicinus TaxID=2954382 RepID=A0A084XVI1_9PROT|nr:DNA topoisomerase III [Candidatus Accumulibacter vicinus]KFB66475.1 MAG: DNA topoisomerase 3 [Candidatus Accumulibacter vicinus]